MHSAVTQGTLPGSNNCHNCPVICHGVAPQVAAPLLATAKLGRRGPPPPPPRAGSDLDDPERVPAPSRVCRRGGQGPPAWHWATVGSFGTGARDELARTPGPQGGPGSATAAHRCRLRPGTSAHTPYRRTAQGVEEKKRPSVCTRPCDRSPRRRKPGLDSGVGRDRSVARRTCGRNAGTDDGSCRSFLCP